MRASETHARALQATSSEPSRGRAPTAALRAAVAMLLAGPTALAFFSGGYFEGPRAWAGLAAWLLVLVGMLADPSAFPRSPVAWLAVGGLAVLAGWTLFSITWAPIAGSAYQASQIVVLYTGVLLGSVMLLRSRPAQRAVEPALAAGALVVVCYGVSERLFPGLLHFARSVTAVGRLEQPLTYWNAMGELAALGFVLSARVAGDITRARAMRAAAAAAAAPFGLGLYLSISRGALFACAAGLIVLVVVATQREQLRAVLGSLAAGALVALPASLMSGFTSLSGSLSSRETEGAIMLAVLVIVAPGAAAAQSRFERDRASAQLELPRRAPVFALAVICTGLALAIVIGAKESSKQSVVSAGVSRLGTLESSRYAYWAVALRDFEAKPLNGVGAGGWAVDWLRYRRIGAFAQDAHSLELQTLAELGIVGFVFLLAFMWGIAQAAIRAHRTRPGLAAGAISGLVVWLAHSPLDWDWQMPALTIVAIVLAGLVVALAAEDVAVEPR